MNVSEQGASARAGFEVGAVEASNQESVKSGASLAGKTVSVHEPNVAGLFIGESAAGTLIADFSIENIGAEVSISQIPESEVPAAEGVTEKTPEPLVLRTYSGHKEALKYLSGLDIKRLLGKGGWGDVHLAEGADGKPLAVKINSVNVENLAGLQANPNKYDIAALCLPEHAHLMKTQAVLVASVEDPNHCGIITHPDQLPADATESLYIAGVISEFAVGLALHHFIKCYRVRYENLITIGRQLAGALAHMHKHGFTHRDVSANNVIYHSRYGLKLIDMGSAINTIKRADSYVGTYQLLKVDGYDPPGLNKRCGFDYDTKALDSWALGCVLWYCLTGKYVNYYRPYFDDFENTNGRESAPNVACFADRTDTEKESIIQKRLLQKGIPPGFINTVVELLRANPAERPSAEDVEKRLDSLQGSDNREGMKTTVV